MAAVFLQNEVLTRGEHKAPESPESSSSLPLSVPPTFWPPWPHDALHQSSRWAVHTGHGVAVSTSVLGSVHSPSPPRSHLITPSGCSSHDPSPGKPLPSPVPLAPTLHLLHVSMILVCIYIIILHIMWLVVHLYTVSMAISPNGGQALCLTVYNITLSSAFAHGGQEILIEWKTILSSPDPILIFPLLCSILLSYWSTSLNGSFSHIRGISGKYFQILPENGFISRPFMNSIIKILVWQLFFLNTSYCWVELCAVKSDCCSRIVILLFLAYYFQHFFFSLVFCNLGMYGFIFFPRSHCSSESVESHLSSILENSQPLTRPNSKATFVSSFLTWLLLGFG